jgi:hypothetical protein
MNNLHLKLLVIGLALLAIVIALHYNLGTFQSAPADPTCPKGQYSRKTGGPCSGPSSDKYDYTRDPPETALGANGERHNVGSYDSNPNAPDDVDYRKTDVLKRPASISYPDWVTDPRTSGDINTRSRLSDWQFRSSKGLDDRDLPSKRVSKDPYDYRYDTSLKSRGNSIDDVYKTKMYDGMDYTEKKFNGVRQHRPTVEELKDTYVKKHSEIPTFRGKRTSDDEDDYLDNRLSRDYKSRERQFELPSEKKYERGATRGYSSTCGTKSYGGDEDDDEEACEGFSPLL